jgi:23S rRNA (uracil1939-C5)-methyltransferase
LAESLFFDMVKRMIQVHLTQIAYNGYAIGRHNGKVVFVSYALPGETVEADIYENRKNWAKARPVRILEKSSRRVEPECPHFGAGGCGGCQWQHIQYDSQLDFKTAIVKEQIRRLGGILTDVVKPAVSAGSPWAYRNHVRLHGGAKGWGFVREDGRGNVDVKTCPIMHEHLADMLAVRLPADKSEKLTLRTGVRTNERMMILETEKSVAPDLKLPESTSLIVVKGKRKPRILAGRDHYFEEVAGRKYRISAKSFFQVNTGGAEILLELVKKYGHPDSTEKVVDLYSGVGLFALPFLSSSDRVTAVESEKSAAEDLRFNGGNQGEKLRILKKNVRSALGKEIESADIIICDPPRRGCGREVIRKITKMVPKKLVYVSCDPATLARDARWLSIYGYILKDVQPVDLFPQTYHIETVSLFQPR